MPEEQLVLHHGLPCAVFPNGDYHTDDLGYILIIIDFITTETPHEKHLVGKGLHLTLKTAFHISGGCVEDIGFRPQLYFLECAG